MNDPYNMIPYYVDNIPCYICITDNKWEIIDQNYNFSPFLMDKLTESEKTNICQYIKLMSTVLVEQLGPWLFKVDV